MNQKDFDYAVHLDALVRKSGAVLFAGLGKVWVYPRSKIAPKLWEDLIKYQNFLLHILAARALDDPPVGFLR